MYIKQIKFQRQSPERAVRHFTEDRSHRRVGEVDNNEESGRVRGREVTKEKRSGHGREKIHEVEAATNVIFEEFLHPSLSCTFRQVSRNTEDEGAKRQGISVVSSDVVR